jgi:hypothetical protein
MNVTALIDAIVRQTTVLIAQLATQSGGRAQLAHIANQVFLDLVAALKEQGVGSKVIADMFGLVLRTYQQKVHRLSESRTIRGRSLWEAVLDHVEQKGPLTRAEVLARFSYDDPASVRGVLRDLVHSGLLYRTGRGAGTNYRSAPHDELVSSAKDSEASFRNLVWVTVQRHRPASVDDLALALAMPADTIERALVELQERGLVVAVAQEDGTARYDSHGCTLPYDDPKGWEAAVYDHYHAMVTALTVKLDQGQRHAQRDDRVGGSTFGFELWESHPYLDEVTSLLRTLREQGTALRDKVAKYNTCHEIPADEDQIKVLSYVGQAVIASKRRPAEPTRARENRP